VTRDPNELEARDGQPPSGPPTEGRFAVRLTRLYGSLKANAAREYRMQFGLPLREGRVLLAVGRLGSMTPKEISQSIAMDKAGVSRTLDALEARGWIQRVVESTRDSRASRISLTPAGRRMFAKLAPFVDGRHERVLSPLTAAERATLLGLMERLQVHLDSMNAESGIDPDELG
jgi:DNA-binding MarR family transcriptional regulator